MTRVTIYLTLSSELDLETLAEVGAVELAAAISYMGVMVRSAAWKLLNTNRFNQSNLYRINRISINRLLACHTSGAPSTKSSRQSEAAVVTWLAAAAAAEGASEGATMADSPPLLITSSAFGIEAIQRSC